MLEISRAQNVRNKTDMPLSIEIKPKEWVHLAVVYCQPQSNEHEEDSNNGLKVYINSELAFED